MTRHASENADALAMIETLRPKTFLGCLFGRRLNNALDRVADLFTADVAFEIDMTKNEEPMPFIVYGDDGARVEYRPAPKGDDQ